MIYFPFRIQTNLGNWLFQYAAALSLGQEVCGWLEDPSAERKLAAYGDLFGNLPLVKELPPGVAVYEEPAFAYHPLPDRLRTGDWLLKGFYQSEKYFNAAALRPSEQTSATTTDIRRRFAPTPATTTAIRRRFAPTPARVADLRRRFGDWLDRPNVTGISVRRGDYLWKAQWHPFVGTRFFKDCLARLPDCRDFIVCSDDIPWCRRFFPKAFPDRNFLFVEGESVLNQLYIHTLCRHNIISNSSFSWWGAWLNAHPQKRLLAPSLWFGFAFRRVGLDWRDIYPAGTEIVRNRYTLARYAWGHLTLLWRWFKVTFYPVKRMLLGRRRAAGR